MSEGRALAISGIPDAELIEVIRRSRLFRDIAIDEVGPLLADCERGMLVAGQKLLSRNAPNDTIYLLLAGSLRVHLMDPADEPASRIEVGECAGEMSVIDGDTVSADVVADSASEVLRIPRTVLWAMVDISHTIARNLLYILSTRMRYGNELIIRNMRTQRVLKIAATIDALTGLHNRGWMDSSFPRAMARCAEKGKAFCVLMVNIDHFKLLNDTWRHVCGDQALVAVAESLLNNVRPEDMLARYGGEEFVIGLPNTDVNDALAIGERLRWAIELLPLSFRSREKLPHVTVSIGVGHMQPGQALTELVAVADEALYRAKDAGRNQVSL